jgi:tetratricopeptide (TPR) repeat protein
MTKRVKQHQLEDLSRAKYSLAIPRNWVMRDKEKDYGIDAEVEIFDDKDRASGLVYWIQLKATETRDRLAAKKVDLSIDAIKYYKSLDIPVLIVRYSENGDLFYSKWAHEIDLFYAKKGAKTIRITFYDEDLWSDNSAVKTIKYLKKLRAIKAGAITLPVSTLMVVKDDTINGIPRGVFMSAYRQALQRFSQIAVYQPDSEKADLCTSLKDDELFISLASVTGCTFHSIQDRDTEGFAEGVVADVLLGLAVSLVGIGQIEMSARILLDNKLIDRFFQKQELLIKFIPIIIKTSRYGEIIDAVCDMIDLNDDNIIESIATVSAVAVADSDNLDKCNKLQKLLEKCLEKNVALGENSLIGVSHYNLGNHFRSRKLYKKAITHYLKARRFENKYLNQSYYYQELGGALFDYEKYRFSAKLYKIALDKGAPNSTKPLYADALMFGGYYKLAHDVFSEYLDSVKDEHAEWHLKNIFLETLIDKKGISEQVRRKHEAINKIDITKAGNSAFIQNLEKAIELDVLCGLAWFNSGIELSKTGKYKEAAFSFIACGLVQTWDIEAWVNATLCCFNKEIPIQILPLALNTAYFFNGDEFMSRLHKELAERFNDDTLIQITNVVDELLSDRVSREAPKIRLMHEDGIFRDIFTGNNV